MRAGAALGEVVDHRAQFAELSRRIRPQVCPVRFALAGTEHLHRRLVGVQHRLLQDGLAECVDQRLQLHATPAHPGTQRGSRDGQSRTTKDLFLAIQGQVVAVLGDQHLREQPGGGHALVDHMRWNRRLDQRLARLAHPLAADVPFHRKHARRVVQLLAHVLADPYAFATALARCAVRFVMDVGAWQLRRQRCPFRLLALPFSSRRLELLELHLDGNQVAIDRLVEQVHLLAVELFAAPAELLAREDRDLVGELIDTGLPEA